MHAIVIAEKGV